MVWNLLLTYNVWFAICYFFFSVLIWATSAIVSKESGEPLVNDQTKMFVAAIVAISCVLFVLRVIFIVFRQRKQPIGCLEDEQDAAISSGTYYGSIFWSISL